MFAQTAQDKKTMGIAILLNLIHLGAIALLWTSLPATLPDHFGINLAPDHWSSKQVLLFIPMISAFIALLCFGIWNNSTFYKIPWAITEENRSLQFALAKELIGKTVIWISLLFISVTAMSSSYGLQINTLPSRIGFCAALAGLLLTVAIYYFKAFKKRK